jgi:hypothetical protein
MSHVISPNEEGELAKRERSGTTRQLDYCPPPLSISAAAASLTVEYGSLITASCTDATIGHHYTPAGAYFKLWRWYQVKCIRSKWTKRVMKMQSQKPAGSFPNS